jgi:hypothetical protein
MTKKEAIDKLRKLQESNDPEVAHELADSMLCEALITLGWAEVITEYLRIKRWFA